MGDLGPSNGFFIGDVLGQEYIDPKLISDSTSINSLRSGFNAFIEDYPYYSLTESVSNELFDITGNETDGDYIWDYSGFVNYSHNKVLNSVNESYFHNDTGTGFFEQKEYRWKMAYYAHCMCGEPPPKSIIPGYPLYLLIGTLVIGTVSLIRKYRSNSQLIT
ncbi:MAG: Loki-CTERM sorting domain-containing protein [Promethearchaeota archaeon]